MYIDPKLFISPPYIECPSCGQHSFGILQIYETHYTRRCKECFFPRTTPYGKDRVASFRLPKLNKKIIYIDQFAISNMMKAVSPKNEFSRTLDKFWAGLFYKLHKLCRLQLIICPESPFHQYESILSSFYEPLKKMYKSLSSGIIFHETDDIKALQIYEHARNWIREKEDEKIKLDVQSIIKGKINGWTSKFIIIGNFPVEQRWVDELRALRGESTEELKKVFQRWQTEKHKTFSEWFEEEAMSYGRIVLRLYYEKRFNLLQVKLGVIEPTIFNLMPSSSQMIVEAIYSAFENQGVESNKLKDKTVDYLKSPSLKNVPFIKINSMLWAALARKAATGRKKPPNQGMANDISLVSMFLPYCDAMFIDNECRGYLLEEPLFSELDFGTKLFSQNNKSEFIEYLDDIKSSASEEHLDKVKEVYGNI